MKKTKKLSTVYQLFEATAKFLWTNRRLFISITLIYGLLNLVLVKGLSSGADISTFKHQITQLFGGDFGSLVSSVGVFALLIGSAGNGSDNTAGAYQFFLAITTSLAVIWALRQVKAGKKIRARDAYYHGMYPLFPFMLVLLAIAVQLLPMAIGAALYTIVITNGIAVALIEKVLWTGVLLVLTVSTFYMISSSIFALYIVSLPDMTPVKALRSARELVKNQRLAIFRKVISLPIVLLVLAGIIMVPLILTVTFLAQWVFFLMTVFSLVVVHTYIYILYRELINEKN